MARKPRKSEFYKLRYRLALNAERAADLCGVSIDEIETWDNEGAPLMAMRLLHLWDRKHVGLDGWHGWMFSRGALICGRLRFRPETLKNYPLLLAKLSRLEIEAETREMPFSWHVNRMLRQSVE